jgi:hypothetical protein
MCDPISLTVASAAIAGGSAIMQGQQAQAMGDYQNAQAQADANAAQGDAEVQAMQIREAGKRQRSAAVAAQAASGVDTGSGTAELINTEITKNSEQDAISTILSGKYRGQQLSNQGAFAKMKGDNAAMAGYASAAGTALNAGSSMYGAWKSPQNVNIGGTIYREGSGRGVNFING